MTDTTTEPTDTASTEAESAKPRTRSDTMSSKEQARLAVAAALDRKAVDLRALDLAGISDFTDIFLICSGTNERQVKAISDNIVSSLRDHKVKPLHVEGYPHGRWILLDYGGDMVIHVFHQDTRSFYELERLWSDAPDLTGELTKGLLPDDEAPGTDGSVASDVSDSSDT